MITIKAISKTVNENLSKRMTDEAARPRIQFMMLYAILGIVSAVMAIVNFFTHNTMLTLAVIIFTLFCFLMFYLLFRCNISLHLSQILFIIGFTALFVFFIVTGIPQGFSILWICLLPSCGMLLFGRKRGSLICLYVFLIVAFFFYTPLGRSLLLYQYNFSFKLRFPLLFCAFYIVGLLFETVHNLTSQELIKTRNEFRHLSSHDALTNAFNRYGFNDAMHRYLNNPDKPIVFFIVDVDFFKSINDKYGHLQGDKSLVEIASVITRVVGDEGTIFRWGGDEFVVVTANPDGASNLAERICVEIRNTPIKLNADTVQITVSIGVAAAEHMSDTSTTKLINAADECLYHSKENGRNRYTVTNIKAAD